MPPPKDETEEQKAIRLAKAKKQAAKSREEKMVEKYKDKVLEKERSKGSVPPDEDETDEEDEEIVKTKPIPKKAKEKERSKESVPPNEEETEKPVKAVARRPPRPKAKVIIEQDSSDDEVFEASKDVIFVKRVRAKKVEQQHAPQSDYRSASAPMPPPVTRQEQPLPQRFQQQQQQQQAPPPKPQISQEKRLEMERYLNMTRGQFLPMSRPR
jgi:hypothetical protein